MVGEGGIHAGDADDDAYGRRRGHGSEGFGKLLQKVANDGSIRRGVIVRIDSPGGDAIASDDILRNMNLLSKRKPMVISMSDVAASGGYYMAMTGDPVLAYPDTSPVRSGSCSEKRICMDSTTR